MITHLKKAAAVAAFAMFSTGAFAQAFIDNGTVEADVNASGTFASLAYSGTEFVQWGTPMSYYWLNSSVGNFVADNASSTNPLSAFTLASGSTVSFNSSTGGLTFNQSISLIGSRAVVSVTLANTTGAAINGVQWGVGIDPDQGAEDTYATINTVVGQGSGAAVSASDPNAPYYGVTLRNTTDAGAFQVRAYIDGTCCSPVDPNLVLSGAAQAIGFSTTDDHSINLAYDIGTIAAGQSATFGYEYVFAPVPEPEIYAMLAAGLGLMGFVARRRQRNGAVA